MGQHLRQDDATILATQFDTTNGHHPRPDVRSCNMANIDIVETNKPRGGVSTKRGRRGMEILGRLRGEQQVSLEVLDVGVETGDEVDSQLVKLAKSREYSILTTDYNLNRVAELQGVQVLNVNELANAVKSVILPGEEMEVNIVQEGKEADQGVAYLDDGTMVVVEGGRRYINSYHDIVVTRVLQTAAGRIIFAQSKNT